MEIELSNGIEANESSVKKNLATTVKPEQEVYL